MKVIKDTIEDALFCQFDSEEAKQIRKMISAVKSSANRLTDDLNRYCLDYSRLTIKDIAVYSSTVNTIILACMSLAELLSEAEYLTAYELNQNNETSCHSQH